jgi:hypothetical protein
MRATPVRASAKVIPFPVRAGRDAKRAAQAHVGVPTVSRARTPKLTPLLCLLAPLLVIGSLLSFLAVVGVFLIWLLIVSVLVVCAIVFAHRLLGRRAAAKRPMLCTIDGNRDESSGEQRESGAA